MNFEKIIKSLWQACSHNKIVRLQNIEKLYHLDGFLYAKVEDENLTGSIKDRTALQMVEDAFKAGRINKNTIFIEATSGNTGISLAYIARELNLKCLIVMPSSMSIERREMIAKYDADLLLVDGGMKECEAKVNELLNSDKRYLCLGQFDNLSNPKAHYLYTAPQIATYGQFDYIVAGIGTGGTISGVGQYFKDNGLNSKIIGVEPMESPLLTKGFSSQHLIQGIGANFIPKTYNYDVVDEIICCPGQEAINLMNVLKKEENIKVGISSGAAIYCAIEILKKNPHTKVMAILPDNGDRYGNK